ncbi:MAG TPA: SURF1 family protein [Candidatus Thioglobus sp.]|jgi:surfeit locus 1 family protein|nr:SURF1 family protein [Candidatus Thioglobus sp.]
MSFKFLLPAALITIMVVFLTSLGFWQLDRADEKRAIEKAIEVANTGTVEIVTELDGLEAKEYYQLRLNGHYLPEKQFIYDNQIVQQTSGYYVITPFVIADSNKAILINRGFMPWNGQRDKLADIELSTSTTEIKVQISLPVKRMELGESEIDTEFPILVQSLDLVEMSGLSGLDFAPVLGLLSPESENGFVRQWKPYTGSIGKHIGYAIQWFLMALVLAFIGIRLGLKYRKS